MSQVEVAMMEFLLATVLAALVFLCFIGPNSAAGSNRR
jgi:hypothetical protein